MRLLAVPTAVALLLTLSACETTPVVETPAPECPVLEVPEACPVCEQVTCPEPQVIEKIVTQPVVVPETVPATAGELNLPIVGAVEWVTVEPPAFKVEARIDTGAETTIIQAQDIKLIEKDGKRYVTYKLTDPETEEVHELETRLRRSVSLKQSDGEADKRYVVRMWLTLGDTRSLVEVGLSDRTDGAYPLLIGRNFLTDVAIVDVAQHHTLAK